MRLGSLILLLASCGGGGREGPDAGLEVDDAAFAPDAVLEHDAGPGAFDPCATSEPIAVSEETMSWIGHLAVAADDDGWIVLWAADHDESMASERGLYAARPGASPVVLDAGSVARVAAVATDHGVLVCWIGVLDDGSSTCGTLGADLSFVRGPAQVAVGPILELSRQDDRLWGHRYDVDGGELVALDEWGDPEGDRIAWPETAAAWNGERFALATRSQDVCGTQFYREGPCELSVHLATNDGAAVSDPVVVAPLPVDELDAWSVTVVPHSDGFLVGWADDAVKARRLDRDGALEDGLALRTDPPGLRELTVQPLGSVTAVLWFRGTGVDRALRPRGALIGPEGLPEWGPDWVGGDGGLREQAARWRVAGRTGRGWAVAWTGEEGFEPLRRSVVYLRAMGCAGPS